MSLYSIHRLLFLGDKFWRFDTKKKPHVDPRYPLSTTTIWELPSYAPIDAAFTAPKNGHVYFFSGPLYYRLDPETFKIAKTYPPYPLSTKTFWFGCRSTSRSHSDGLRDRTIRMDDDQDQYEDDDNDDRSIKFKDDSDEDD